ncbi:MAG: cytidylate kinase-like family protein [Pirellulales bacterium]|nr:cytidylate kinase-like family protein [Pirellulales bacterium]
MRTWALALELTPPPEPPDKTQLQQLFKPYLALSREAGVDAAYITHSVAERLNWKVLDREVVDYIAEQHRWSRVSVESVDERKASWFHDTLGKWLDSKLVSQVEYVRGLGRIVALAAQRGNVVFVGRGAQFLLPKERGLTVRLIAPRKARIHAIVQDEKCDERQAELLLDETDRGRSDFVRRYFHRDIADPAVYDLVLNLERLTKDDAAELIVKATCQRFPDAVRQP